MSAHADPAAPRHCENCGTALQGRYCHACGQSIVNPIRHTAHAIEEVFEAFWHLDGRVFRTLRDLLVPGRVAINYLLGQRARYIAPLRLFVVLSVLTFFVGQMAIHVERPRANEAAAARPGGEAGPGDDDVELFARADDIADVERRRYKRLRELAEARAAIPSVVTVARAGIDRQIAAVERAADARIEQLRVERGLSAEQVAAARAEAARANAAKAPPGDALRQARSLAEVERLRDQRLAPLHARLADAADAAARRARLHEIRQTNRAAGCRAAQLQIDHAAVSERGLRRDPTRDAAVYGDPECDDVDLSFDGEPWDPVDHPLRVEWAPEFFNRWLNRQIGHGRENLARAQKDPGLYVRALLGAVPSALFLLVPVFALLLKLAYLGSGRLYLEHLAVALYSHAFLCLALLAMFLLAALSGAIAPHWAPFGWISGLLQGLLWLWLPVYLLLMQKRVYRNGWPLTLLRYFVVGHLYFVLLSFAAAFLALASLVRM
ncbi:DUF3667 domain-containing protein [Vulcaniibacterium tengchongense]|uniref:Uncharacterized protein DUF3667 n=1 Tax=Vulcaniibacterium tengchongense TaxID=1273429 RepID=A0A3N4VA29_9GAMM|nr:DUF3667 domain-containing protein [Vulcaniibacterium tengchongense]RPE79842.1 uncharacterized protein DUF3667 [Vulcaniibacterium tengchongense]